MRKLLSLVLLLLISCSSINVKPEDLRTDPVADHRRLAAQSIGEEQQKRYLPALLEALHSDDVSIVRAQAARSIGHLGVRRPQVYEQLIEALKNDPSALVQQDVITALSELNYGKKATSTLIEKLRSSPHPAVRADAATALEQIGTEEAIAALEKGLDDESDQVRFASRDSLRNIGAYSQGPEEPSVRWWMVR